MKKKQKLTRNAVHDIGQRYMSDAKVAHHHHHHHHHLAHDDQQTKYTMYTYADSDATVPTVCNLCVLATCPLLLPLAPGCQGQRKKATHCKATQTPTINAS